MIYKKYTLLLTLMAGVLFANAQLRAGKKNIDKLCGCFDVQFKYAETFSPDNNYKFHERENLHGTELVLPIETSDKKIVLQHLLVINDSTIVKHWREDWVYEQAVLLQYEGNKEWTKVLLSKQDAADKWVQTVWETDDAPRYQGISQWVNIDGKTFWQSTVNAPLPRREYSTRTDYNILKRGNRIVVTDSGWVHEQDNSKLLRSGNNYQLVAEEKGINDYHKINYQYCEKAKEWWEANNIFWTTVRDAWDNYIKTHDRIVLQSTIDEKSLAAHFANLSKQWYSKLISKPEMDTKIKTLIQQFSEGKVTASAVKDE